MPVRKPWALVKPVNQKACKSRNPGSWNRWWIFQGVSSLKVGNFLGMNQKLPHLHLLSSLFQPGVQHLLSLREAGKPTCFFVLLCGKKSTSKHVSIQRCIAVPVLHPKFLNFQCNISTIASMMTFRCISAHRQQTQQNSNRQQQSPNLLFASQVGH